MTLIALTSITMFNERQCCWAHQVRRIKHERRWEGSECQNDFSGAVWTEWGAWDNWRWTFVKNFDWLKCGWMSWAWLSSVKNLNLASEKLWRRVSARQSRAQAKIGIKFMTKGAVLFRHQVYDRRSIFACSSKLWAFAYAASKNKPFCHIFK